MRTLIVTLAMALLLAPWQAVHAADTYIPLISAPPAASPPAPAPLVLQAGRYVYEDADQWLTVTVLDGGAQATSAAFTLDKTAQLPAYCRPVGTVFVQTRPINDGFVRFQDADLGSLRVYAEMKCTALSADALSCYAVYYASGAGLGYGCFSTTATLTRQP